jgi:hypothetical protein
MSSPSHSRSSTPPLSNSIVPRERDRPASGRAGKRIQTIQSSQSNTSIERPHTSRDRPTRPSSSPIYRSVPSPHTSRPQSAATTIAATLSDKHASLASTYLLLNQSHLTRVRLKETYVEEKTNPQVKVGELKKRIGLLNGEKKTILEQLEWEIKVKQTKIHNNNNNKTRIKKHNIKNNTEGNCLELIIALINVEKFTRI